MLDILTTPDKYDELRVNAWNRSKTFAWDKVVEPVCDWLESQAAGKTQPERRKPHWTKTDVVKS